MSWSLRFGARLVYDAGQPSITVPVHLSVGEERVTTSAKLDTGASHSIFSRELGEQLGLAVAAGERLKIETVTGHFICYGHEVTVTGVDLALDTTVYFAAEYGFPVNVLGRRGWIERLRLGLDDYDGLLLASHYDAEE